MTIFDVIRYPISDFPTEAELEALPKDLYDKWIETYWTIGGPSSPKVFAGWFASWKIQETSVYCIEDLRQMIKDYDEPI